jgi:P-type Mg2+ transporter
VEPALDFWSVSAERLLERLGARPSGLSSEEAARRLLASGPNVPAEARDPSRLRTLGRQLKSPLLLLLVFAAAASAASGEWVDAAMVVVIVAVSGGVGYRREYQAHRAAAALNARVRARAQVLRDGREQPIAAAELVPGDVVLLSVGSLVPADGRLLAAEGLEVIEAPLTGESFPARKSLEAVAPDCPLAKQSSCARQGTSVRCGTGRLLVVRTGANTELGRVAGRLEAEPPETEFDRGLRRFGRLLLVVMATMSVLVVAAHTLTGRPPMQSLLFAVALAVGLSPELLPAILSVSLARSAVAMAGEGVLVRRLNAIENLGSMDVLCTDKTGTITEGVVRLDGAFDALGRPSSHVLALAAFNAALQSGLASPLDQAILERHPSNVPSSARRGELPFDFERKRASVAIDTAEGPRLICKGAFRSVLPLCTGADAAALVALHQAWAERGTRVLAVAERALEPGEVLSGASEARLQFAGFLTFLDRPKAGTAEAIADLERLGVTVKVISGDSAAVARHVAEQVGLGDCRALSGAEIDGLDAAALAREVDRTAVFAEVDPSQKERVVKALRAAGHVVGFLGDGVNDALAMRAADTSLSVDQAVDVAREAADFVLLERSLDVIRRGIEQGRKTFANTLKYVLTTTSANLGNMLSMAAASLVIPFLPLTAGQILLNNLLSDVPAVGLAADDVDPEMVARPRRWNLRFIARFMLAFGGLSSVMDLLTFAVLLWGFGAGVELFRTGWFVESLLTELAVALVLRTWGPAWRSRPGALLVATTAGVAAVALALPWLPVGTWLGFVPLPLDLLGAIIAITFAYVAATEALKRWYFRSSRAPDALQPRPALPVAPLPRTDGRAS